MTPERWKQIDELAQSALERGGDEGAAFLDEACAGDDALRREVESQIAYQQQASKFLEEPAFKHAAELIADSQTETESMEARTISHYSILRKLGAGGMGEVYLAQDTTLGRKVAIKFLSQNSVAGEQARKRLVREAKAAAALDHPHICAVHEVGEEAGYSFIVMQYVEGETLERRIQRQPLELREAIDIAAQIADALAEAHDNKIIHRDIKPSNIMLTNRGQVKVLDFGLAKTVAGGMAGSEEAETKSLLTEPGMIVGTAPYMSPEQVRGETVDPRSDIFSFGAMFYEMLSGGQAFRRESVADTISAILSYEPRHLSSGALNIPTELERIVRKCLAKDKERRYQTTRDLLIDTQSLQHALTAEAPRNETTTAEAETAKLPGSATTQGPTSWRERLAGRRGGWLAMSLAAVLVGVLVLIYVWQPDDSAIARAPIKSLAVLPLENLSNDTSQEYFADGMTDALITELAKIGTLRVIARSSSMLFKGKRKPLAEIASELNVDAVVEGSVLRSGDKVRIATQLFHAATGQNLWSESYERDLRDVLSIQGEVARGIVREIKIKITPQEDAVLSRKRPVNPEAEDAYLRGLFFSNQGINADSPVERRVLLEKSFDYLQQAIRIDPNYAQAYATLAGSYQWHASRGGFPGFYPKSKEAALKAIEIDDSNADAHAALAFIAWMYEWDAALAEREYKRASELSPNSNGHGYALLLSTLGRHEEAIEQIRRAEAIDPLTLPLKINMVAIFMSARQYDPALEQIKRLLELNPNWVEVRAQLVATYAFKGRYEEAIAERLKDIEHRKGNARSDLLLASIYAEAGRRIEAIKILDGRKKSPESEPTPGFVAQIHAILGDKEQAFVWLERAFAVRAQGLRGLKTAPAFDSMRSEPRFQEMLRRAGFPE